MRKAMIHALVAATLTIPARADVREVVRLAYDGLCARIVAQVDVILNESGWPTRTRCVVGADHKRVVLMFAADQPVFAVAAARRAWAMVVVLAAGKAIRESADLRVEDLGLTDSALLERRKMAHIAASFASQLQADVYAGRRSGAAAIDEIDARLRLEDAPAE